MAAAHVEQVIPLSERDLQPERRGVSLKKSASLWFTKNSEDGVDHTLEPRRMSQDPDAPIYSELLLKYPGVSEFLAGPSKFQARVWPYGHVLETQYQSEDTVEYSIFDGENENCYPESGQNDSG